MLVKNKINKFQNGGTSDKQHKGWYYSNYWQSAMLPEVLVNGYSPIKLTTYYPITSEEYPYTGHSELEVPISKKYFEDSQPWHNYYLEINKKSASPDYNIVTNNCADATLNFLNEAFGTDEKPLLFTTPGDVQDYASTYLNGKVYKGKGKDTVIIPVNKNNYKKISEAALRYLKNSSDYTSYLHMTANPGVYRDYNMKNIFESGNYE